MKTLAQASEIMVKSGGSAAEIDDMAMPFNEWIELVDFSYWNKINGNE